MPKTSKTAHADIDSEKDKLAQVAGCADFNEFSSKVLSGTEYNVKDFGATTVSFGGMQWWPVYAQEDSGRVKLTLWLKTSIDNYSFSDGTYSAHSETPQPSCNDYKYSWIRAAINAGTTTIPVDGKEEAAYYGSWSGTNQPTKYNNSEPSLSGKVVAPIEFTTFFSIISNPFIIPGSEYNDPIWLPSTAEAASGGTWGCTSTQWANNGSTGYCWTRSSYPSIYYFACYLNSSGVNGHTNVYRTYGIRPALNVDLAAVDEDAKFIVDPDPTKPTADTTVFTYTGSPLTYSPKNFNASSMTISAENDDNTQTDAGTYFVTVTSNTNVFSPITFTFTINKATPKVAEGNKADSYDPASMPDLSAILSATNPVSGIDVDGTFTYNDNPTPTAGGTKTYNWTFTPTDANNYNKATGTISLTFDELPVEPDPDNPDPDNPDPDNPDPDVPDPDNPDPDNPSGGSGSTDGDNTDDNDPNNPGGSGSGSGSTDGDNTDDNDPNNPGGSGSGSTDGDNTDNTDPSNPGGSGSGSTGGDNTDDNDPNNPSGGGTTDPSNPGGTTDPNDPNNPGGGSGTTDPTDPSNPGGSGTTDPNDPNNPGNNDGNDDVNGGGSTDSDNNSKENNTSGAGATEMLNKIKDIMSKPVAGLALWLWILIAIAALIMLIIIIAIAKKHSKNKEQREEIKARKAEEKARRDEERQRREEERRLQKEKLDAERELARARQEAELEKIRAQAGLAGMGAASMAMAQPNVQPPVAQQSVPLTAAQPQPIIVNGGSDNSQVIAQLKAEVAELRARQNAQQPNYAPPQYAPATAPAPQPAAAPAWDSVTLARLEAQLNAMQAEQRARYEAEQHAEQNSALKTELALKNELEMMKLRLDQRQPTAAQQIVQSGGVSVDGELEKIVAVATAVWRNMQAQQSAEVKPVTSAEDGKAYPPDAVVTTTTTVDTTKNKPLARSREKQSEFTDVDGFYDDYN